MSSNEARETLELDVVFVGAGPANLAGAYRLAKLIDDYNRHSPVESHLDVSIAVLEKGHEVGSHILSGAVFDPRALRELLPAEWRHAPFEGAVEAEHLWWLTEKRSIPLPIPPQLENHGCYVASLGKLVKWLAPKVEAAGVDIFCEFPAKQLLFENGRVTGVRTADRGIDKQGNRKANFEPGVDIRSQVVVLGEGPLGTLTKQLDERLDLWNGRNPQVYALGLKEIWEVPETRLAPGEVIHTMGWPLDSSTFGGGFLYGMGNNLLTVGLVVGLDYSNPWLDPHQEFQRFKTHTRIADLLEGGKMSFYGAKAIPEGGWWSIPQLAGEGFLIVGDSAGLLNGQRLKGIHLGMKSGMLTAETIFEGLLADDLSGPALGGFEQKVNQSWIREEMWPVRNFHQAFDRGTAGGLAQVGLGMLTDGRGWGLFDRLHTDPGHTRMESLDSHAQPEPVELDGQLTFDKMANVYHSGTAHEEDQPVHLIVHDTDICALQCAREYGNPCERFCPAGVYEMVADERSPAGKRLQINASNCVHCKTCDIMDPYQLITWVTPEGGGGPKYSKM